VIPEPPIPSEQESFRALIHRFIDDQTLQPTFDDNEQFISALREFRDQLASAAIWSGQLEDVAQCLVLRMPLASLNLYELHIAPDLHIIMVLGHWPRLKPPDNAGDGLPDMGAGCRLCLQEDVC
jgi:hypothetical protein